MDRKSGESRGQEKGETVTYPVGVSGRAESDDTVIVRGQGGGEREDGGGGGSECRLRAVPLLLLLCESKDEEYDCARNLSPG